MLVIGGPEQGGDFLWWQVRLLDGTEGWVAGDFLRPVAAPGAEGALDNDETTATAEP
jgi:hypothetical protein